MDNLTLRRDFLKMAPAVPAILACAANESNAQTTTGSSHRLLESFDFQGVRLRDSRFQKQFQSARDYYFAVPNDDILQGFRAAAGLPAPGQPLGGWCARDSSTVFGQWLSGMSRISRVTGDVAMREKATELMREWGKTIAPDGDCRMRHYAYEKLVCGLVDMYAYAGRREAIDLLAKVTAFAAKTFNRDRVPATPGPQGQGSGRPGEWYTLSENLYRAYQVSQNPEFKTFADVWLYPTYWNKFAETAAPTDAYGLHAYSHVNTFSSAAMAYAVSGDPLYLRAIRNAYDYLQNTQCFATGGYGPVERLMPVNGNLGRSLESAPNTCEAPCGSWAGLKLTRYLTEFTGESRYGDWAERLLYNVIGSALEIRDHGRHFYYADYRLGAGVKIYSREPYTCCSGSYIQNMAEYHNQICFKDASALYINLYVPSEITWKRPDGDVKLTQETGYPETETISWKLEMAKSESFPLKFRVPGWSRNVSVTVNGGAVTVPAQPGTWAVVSRTWNSGDRVEVRIPLELRYAPVDRQHPKRVAVMRGPLVLAEEGNYHEAVFALPESEEGLSKALIAEGGPAIFRIVPREGGNVMAKFRPFYTFGESYYYRMYFDLDKLPVALWSAG